MGCSAWKKQAGKLRLGSKPSAPCDICGRDLPSRYLRVAHIKKRSLCTDQEKRDPDVVMLACVECDALFEAKEIVVDDSGVIEAGGLSGATEALEQMLSDIVGRKRAAFSAKTSPYFKFHRTLPASRT